MNSTHAKADTVHNRKARNVALTVATPALAMTALVAPATTGAATAFAAAEQPTADNQTTAETTEVAELNPAMPPALESRITYFRGGGTMVPGNKWLQGKGVDVRFGPQCTELASRLYAQKKWGSITNFYGMHPGRTYSRTLSFHANNGKYVPVPGDVLVELGGPYQHVAVVDYVTKNAVHTVEQNAVPSGRHLYPIKGHKVFGAYGPRHVGGFIHSKKNPFGNEDAAEASKQPSKKPTNKPNHKPTKHNNSNHKHSNHKHK